MFSRYFLTFCAIVLVAAFAVASAEQEFDDDFENSSLNVEERSKIGKKIEKILKKFFKHVNEHCIKEMVKKCKKHWINPSKVVDCAKDYVTEQGPTCVVGA